MDSNVSVMAGVIVPSGATLAVNVAGSIFPASLPVGYTPTVGDIVNVIKAGDRCFVFAITGQTTADFAPPPPPQIETGADKFLAGSSGYYSTETGAAPRWRDHLIAQGDLPTFGQTYRGAWIYGVNPTRLKDATITKLRLRIPDVVYWGRPASPSGPLALHLLSDSTRPTGDTTPIQGPLYVEVTKDAKTQWVDLPTQWGQYLANNGGGLGIRGDFPMGFATPGPSGYPTDPASGQIELTWQR